MSYDVLVIGGGPAGLSASINVRARGRSALVVSNPLEENPLWRAEKVDNYLGLPGLSGAEMLAAMRRHAEQAGVEFLAGKVLNAVQMPDAWYVSVGPDMYNARAVVLAAGVARGKKFAGEAELLGRGVSYCATCDGNLYRGKTIAIVCTHRRFEGEVEYLAHLAAKVYYLPLYQEPGITLPNVEYLSKRIVRVQGEQGRLNSILLKDGEEIPVNGLFFLRESVSLTTLLPGLATSQGHIVVDRQMATNLPGCFAAGDCTGRPYQYVKAAGEGNVAAHSMVEYLARSQE